MRNVFPTFDLITNATDHLRRPCHPFSPGRNQGIANLPFERKGQKRKKRVWNSQNDKEKIENCRTDINHDKQSATLPSPAEGVAKGRERPDFATPVLNVLLCTLAGRVCARRRKPFRRQGACSPKPLLHPPLLGSIAGRSLRFCNTL